LYGYAGQDQKRQNSDDIINKPGYKPKENSHLGIGTLITLSKLTDEMDPNYILHVLPSQREERSEKWAWPLIATEKKVNQNEAIFNFLQHNSLILNEWAVSGDGKDYMKLEPNLSTETKDTEKEVFDKICMMMTRLACNRAIESSYWRMDNDSDVGLLTGYVLYQLPVELEFMDLDTFPR
jgi:hypothetical protein